MKHFKLFSVLFVFLFCSFVKSDCNVESAKSFCIKNLDSGFSMLKTYDIEDGDEEFSFIFSRGVNYMITNALVTNPSSQVEVRLYDKSKKLIFTNYHKRKKEFSKTLYSCTYTGIHYIQFKSPKNATKVCAAGVLGYKRR